MQRFRLTLLVLALAFLAGCVGGALPPPTPAANDYAAQFDTLWANFDQRYTYFGVKHVDWAALRARFRTEAAAAGNEAELVATVRQMLGALHDQHVVLRDPAGHVFPTYVPAQPVNWNQAVWQRYVRQAGWVQGRSNWGYAGFDGAGYMAIGSWDSKEVKLADLEAALETFRDAPALILDVRMNSGGDMQMAYEFAGRFAAVARTAEYLQYKSGPLHDDFTGMIARSVAPRGAWQFTRPVVLLTGRGSASSNESFIAAMRELPNVITMGDVTAGSSGNPETFQLGAGWTYTVSRWIDYTADRQLIEDRGIAPMIAIAATQADFAQGRDPVLEAALAYFNASAPAQGHEALDDARSPALIYTGVAGSLP
ncbi:MAG: S41 family peptidase [Acidobacteria bacterium]|nr:S41 family peptidase [Acidobacteriota bacterium]